MGTRMGNYRHIVSIATHLADRYLVAPDMFTVERCGVDQRTGISGSRSRRYLPGA